MNFGNMTFALLEIAGFLGAAIGLIFVILVLVELIAAIVKRGGK